MKALSTLIGLVCVFFSFVVPNSAAAQTGTVELVDTTSVRAVAVGTTGLAVVTTQGGGFMRSLDYGATWTPVSVDLPSPALAVAICDDHSVFVGTSDGLFHSTDEALTWAHVGQTAGPYGDILCLPATTDILLARPGDNLYALRDNGTRYDSLVAPLPNALGGRFTIGRSASDEIIAGFVGCQEWSCGALFTSKDGGLSFESDSLWNNLWPAFETAITESGIVHVQSWTFAAIRTRTPGWGTAQRLPDAYRVVPLYGDSLLAATTSGLFVSADAGVTWQKVSSPYATVLARDAAMFDDGTILAATSGGIVRIRGGVPTSVEKLPPDVAPSASLEVYPNPFGSSMMIRATGASCSGSIDLLDITGRRIAAIAGEARPGEWIRYETPQDLATGPYVVRAICSDGYASTFVVHAAAR